MRYLFLVVISKVKNYVLAFFRGNLMECTGSARNRGPTGEGDMYNPNFYEKHIQDALDELFYHIHRERRKATPDLVLITKLECLRDTLAPAAVQAAFLYPEHKSDAE